MVENPASHFLQRLAGRSIHAGEAAAQPVLRPRLPGRFEPALGGVIPGAAAPIEVQDVAVPPASIGVPPVGQAAPATASSHSEAGGTRSISGVQPVYAAEHIASTRGAELVSAQIQAARHAAGSSIGEQHREPAGAAHPGQQPEQAGAQPAAGVSPDELNALRQSLLAELQRQAAGAAAAAVSSRLEMDQESRLLQVSVQSSAQVQPASLQAAGRPSDSLPVQALRQTLRLDEEKSLASAQTQSADQSRTVVVSIGRIEVRAASAPHKPQKTSAAAGSSQPAVMSLEEYLAGRTDARQHRGGAR